MIPIRKTLEADVVIAGGGIGGAMAAISAREAGAERVVVLEKCNVRRSGSGATGNDHSAAISPKSTARTSSPCSGKPWGA